MKVLFVGGTGIISSACSELAIRHGIDLYLLNRGRSFRPTPEGAISIHGDVRQHVSLMGALGNLTFDAVVEWVAFTPDQVKTDIEIFQKRTGQYIFISSASAYQKPPGFLPITESTPLHNPFWQYSRDKAACEALLENAGKAEGFPFTIVRPSHTYDECLSVNQIYNSTAQAAGVEPELVHVPSDLIARVDPDWGASLLGDKAYSMIFDNRKIRQLVPQFH